MSEAERADILVKFPYLLTAPGWSYTDKRITDASRTTSNELVRLEGEIDKLKNEIFILKELMQALIKNP